MFARLRGEVIERTTTQIVVDVNGVGYLVTVTTQTSFKMGERVDLHIHTAVRDDAIQLYGFSSRDEKELFDLLITVPGVGPVKAMGILQTPVAQFKMMVGQREAGRLAKLPGVGKKTAERILVDLADKIAVISSGSGVPVISKTPKTPRASMNPTTRELEVTSALVNLGFKEAIAMESARLSIEKLGQDAVLEELIREALTVSRSN